MIQVADVSVILNKVGRFIISVSKLLVGRHYLSMSGITRLLERDATMPLEQQASEINKKDHTFPGVSQLVDGMLWEHEAKSSSLFTWTKD